MSARRRSGVAAAALAAAVLAAAAPGVAALAQGAAKGGAEAPARPAPAQGTQRPGGGTSRGGGLDPATVVGWEREANGRCRGGSGDRQETWEACGQRDAYVRVLGALGWCYGRRGQAGFQQEWHRCGPDSNRPPGAAG